MNNNYNSNIFSNGITDNNVNNYKDNEDANLEDNKDINITTNTHMNINSNNDNENYRINIHKAHVNWWRTDY